MLVIHHPITVIVHIYSPETHSSEGITFSWIGEPRHLYSWKIARLDGDHEETIKEGQQKRGKDIIIIYRIPNGALEAGEYKFTVTDEYAKCSEFQKFTIIGNYAYVYTCMRI